MPLVNRTREDEPLKVVWQFSAPVDKLWKVLTDKHTMPQWLGKPLQFDLREGGTIIVDHGEDYPCHSEIEILSENERLKMSWQFPDEHLTDVDFVLEPAGRRASTLRVTHSDLDDQEEAYRTGWVVHLTYLESVVNGHPIPQKEFWSLFETISRINAE